MTHGSPFGPLTTFRNRLLKIGIDCQFIGNYPWIYLDTVNGNRVKEKFQADHGFTIAFHPIKPGQELNFTDMRYMFEIIRKYK